MLGVQTIAHITLHIWQWRLSVVIFRLKFLEPRDSEAPCSFWQILEVELTKMKSPVTVHIRGPIQGYI